MKIDDFVQYVVCPTCHSIYSYEECIVSRANGTKESKLCKHRPFPNHPHCSRRKECGTTLLRTVKTQGGIYLKPRNIYCYRSIKSYLLQFYNRPNFDTLCEEWRSRLSTTNVLGDVYDGRVWQEFQLIDGIPFLSAPNNLLLSMNVDWFRPYTHTNESIGALYIVIQNLPRQYRYKPENVLLCGIIPGPKEPPGTLNSYLAPVVNDLLELWDGISLRLNNGRVVTCRAALACCACDLPATRKLLGFSSYNSSCACSKYFQFFPYMKDDDKFDFSNFDPQTRKPRDHHQHRVDCDKYKKATTKAAQNKIVKEKGVRYCELLKLPYFNPICHRVVDPMHNLLLGTAKHVMHTWNDQKIKTDSHFKKMGEIIEKLHCPADIGRVPNKVNASFAGFTADQWRNWTTVFSSVVLREVLNGDHLRCWMLFVKACQLLCSRVINFQDIETAHAY